MIIHHKWNVSQFSMVDLTFESQQKLKLIKVTYHIYRTKNGYIVKSINIQHFRLSHNINS
jgi:hypothetical protein